MRKTLLWLLFSFAAFQACADPLDVDVGNPERPNRAAPARVPYDSFGGCSLGMGDRSLRIQGSPAYCDIAIGHRAIQSNKTTSSLVISGHNNTAMGFFSLNKITSASDDTALGAGGNFATSGPASNLTTGSRDIFLGAEAGYNYSTSSDVIALESEGATSGSGTSNNNVLIDTHGGWSGSNTVLLGADPGYSGLFTCNYVTLAGYSAGRLNVCSAAIENNIILFGAGATAGAANTHDVATSSSNNAISIGGAVSAANGSHPGTNDTVVGFGVLKTNAQDAAFQSGFGFNSLFTSNVANARNTGFGYQTGKLVTTGTNNSFLGYNAGSATLTTGSSNVIIGSGITAPASGSASELNIGGLVFGHLAGSAAPTISACGTSPSVDARANNASGTVTVGSVAAASCTVTFASAYTTWNHCKVTSQTGGLAAFAYSYTTSAITVTGTSIVGDVLDYVCDGY